MYRVARVHPTGLTINQGCRQLSTGFPQALASAGRRRSQRSNGALWRDRYRVCRGCIGTAILDMQSLSQRLEVNCSPRSKVIVLGTPKCEIQVNVNPLTPKKEIILRFSSALHNSKNVLLQEFFLFRTVKKLLCIIRLFISDNALSKIIFKTKLPSSSHGLRCSEQFKTSKYLDPVLRNCIFCTKNLPKIVKKHC